MFYTIDALMSAWEECWTNPGLIRDVIPNTKVVDNIVHKMLVD